jgi:iron(III) transport system substrate-binding protein
VSDSPDTFKTRLGRQLRRPGVQLILFFVVWCAWFFWRSSGAPATPLVVYCAHDAVFSEQILRDFEKRTGIAVSLRFDTEATKSLGLTEMLIREKDAPRCDVYWNNELLGMMDLQQRGLLLPYQGSGYARIPAAFKAADGSWTGFAARLRVTIANTGTPVGTTEPNLEEIVPGSDLSKIAIAKPLYGTTLTHYAALWQLWGREKLIAWHRAWRANGGQECNGNGGVKDIVAAGVCYAGYTDTDDFFEAKDEGRPVVMYPVRLENGQTIAIPNTVAIIRGTKRLEAAQQLVDFLLSADTEIALARSKARQIPLGPVPVDQVPAEVKELARWVKDSFDLTSISAARAECLAWLKSEYLQ